MDILDRPLFGPSLVVWGVDICRDSFFMSFYVDCTEVEQSNHGPLRDTNNKTPEFQVIAHQPFSRSLTWVPLVSLGGPGIPLGDLDQLDGTPMAPFSG